MTVIAFRRTRPPQAAAVVQNPNGSWTGIVTGQDGGVLWRCGMGFFERTIAQQEADAQLRALLVGEAA